MATYQTKDGADVSQLLETFETLVQRMNNVVEANVRLEKQIRDYRQKETSVTAEGARQSSPKNEMPDGEWMNDASVFPGIQAWQRLKEIRANLEDGIEQNHVANSIHEALEKDFTTAGPQGDLKCPFAEKAAVQRFRRAESLHQRPRSLPTPPGLKEQLTEDPIAAEFHADTFASPPPSAHGSAAKCPIRFLEDHSPEEVAKYFENHKHEIPRSHEVCVRRHQTNAESIRQLDAKYGNLVNMIQGLGLKHQPMFPSGEEDRKSSLVAIGKTSEKIENWAENCVDSVPPLASEHETDETGDDRNGHFERPLKEVRLGESPSRPWGIQVPLDKQTAASADPHEISSDAAQSISVPVHGSPQPPAKSPQRCPFGHGTRESPLESKQHEELKQPALRTTRALDESSDSKKPTPANIIFNGPVFFGYSPSDASELLRSLQSRGPE